MTQGRFLVTWAEISQYLPSKPSVRTLQRKFRELCLPIEVDPITGKKVADPQKLDRWMQLNPKKI